MTVWVVVADSVRARIFSTESSREPLREVRDLVHPESRMPEQALISDASGSGRSAAGGGHSFGVEGEAKTHETERFAREVGEALCEAGGRQQFDRLHILAAPTFLGQLRPHLESVSARVSSEHALSVTHESVAQIRARLPARI